MTSPSVRSVGFIALGIGLSICPKAKQLYLYSTQGVILALSKQISGLSGGNDADDHLGT